jgi:poly-gamma-glutamate synthesis protein (capsule biosynthesis protein)
MDEQLMLFLGGDVMLGRGVDQILAHPGDPRLAEPAVRDARDYVRLAERAHGPVPRPVDPAWPWGDALTVLAEAAPDVRIVNLETSVTTSDDFAPGKQVHYRMHPANLPALAVARPDVCVLANNHVGDFGPRGLLETVEVLTRDGLRAVGAGRDAAEAARPAVLPLGDGRRVLVFAVGTPSSGIPPGWAAATDRPGVALTEPTDHGAAALAASVDAVRGPSDTAVVSIHWGPNWSDGVPRRHRRFAHRLVDAGVDLVHGHSSHHPGAIEVYRGRLILYGCGDLVDDYEGIRGHERYRPDLRLMYLVRIDRGSGCLLELGMVPMQARQLRLRRAGAADAAWLARTLTGVSAGLAPPTTVTEEGTLVLRPPALGLCRAGWAGAQEGTDRRSGPVPEKERVRSWRSSRVRMSPAGVPGRDGLLRRPRHLCARTGAAG